MTTSRTHGEAAASGALIFIEKKEILAAVTTVTFSGLDGNADGIYVLESFFVPGSVAVMTYRLNPNGLTTNQGCDIAAMAAAYAHTTDARIRIGFAVSGSPAHQNYCTTKIWARATGPGGVGLRRNFRTEFDIGQERSLSTGVWTDTTTNITSLEIDSSIASGIGIGSTFALYKLDI